MKTLLHSIILIIAFFAAPWAFADEATDARVEMRELREVAGTDTYADLAIYTHTTERGMNLRFHDAVAVEVITVAKNTVTVKDSAGKTFSAKIFPGFSATVKPGDKVAVGVYSLTQGKRGQAKKLALLNLLESEAALDEVALE